MRHFGSLLFVILLICALFIVFCYVVGIIAIPMSASNEEMHINPVVVGFFLIVIIQAIVGLILPSFISLDARSLSLSLMVFILATALIKRNKFKPKGKDFKLTFWGFGFAVVLMIYFICGVTSIRFHSSPDNHGFAATISLLSENTGFSHFQDSFMHVTGSTVPAFLDGPTALLRSPWNILDARQRFASDMVLTVGRYGLPLVMSTLWTWVPPVEGFETLMIFFGIFGVWTISISMISSVHSLITHIDARRGDKFVSIPSMIKAFSVLFICLSPLATLLILEGTVTQIWMLAAVAWQFSMHLSRITLKLNHKKNLAMNFLILGLAPLFTAVSYPHGLILMLPIIAVGTLIELLLNSHPIKLLQRISVLYSILFLVVLGVLFRTVRFTFLPMAAKFIKGISGAPFNLGLFSITDAIFWKGSSFVFTHPKSGTTFGIIRNSVTANQVELIYFLLILVLIFSCWWRYPDKRKLLCVYALIGSIFIIPMTRMRVWDSQGNAYIYSRHVGNFLTISMPVLIALLFISLRNSTGIFSRWWKARIKLVLAIALVFQIILFSNATKEFKQSSEPFLVDSSLLLTDRDLGSALLFTTTPNHRVFALSLFGSVNYLTDDWQPRLLPSSITYNCYYLQIDMQGSITAQLIGTLRPTHIIDGPVTVQDLSFENDFTANLAYEDLITELEEK